MTPNSSYTDSTCVGKSTPPRLSFPAHSAPIDAAFDKTASNLYVTFHGSWNRQPATGYKLIEIPFTNSTTPGIFEPAAKGDSKTGYTDVVAASNPGSCASQTLTMSSCWRPSAVQWDPAGTRLFIATDNQSEGEIFVLKKNR